MKTIKELQKDKRLLRCESPDDLPYSISIRAKVNEWSSESTAWIESFIDIIETRGYAYDRFGCKYTIVS